MTWLLTALKALGGVYKLRSRNSVAELPAGSVVLFRYADVVVGEAVVVEYSRESPSRAGQTLLGERQDYEAYVRFSPGSIRVYAPPVEINELQSSIGDAPNLVPSAQPYFKIEDWAVYPKLLACVARSGGFM